MGRKARRKGGWKEGERKGRVGGTKGEGREKEVFLFLELLSIYLKRGKKVCNFPKECKYLMPIGIEKSEYLRFPFIFCEVFLEKWKTKIKQIL